jgi:predicted PurR-regulated permease PerM
MNGEGREVSINISSATITKFFLIALLLVVLYLIRDVVIVVLFSVVIASAVNPAVGWLQKKGVPRALGTFIIFLILFVILAVILFIIIKPLSSELENLSETFPLYFDKISLEFEQVKSSSPQYEEILGNIQTYLSGISDSLKSFATNIFAALAKIFGGIATAVIVIFMSFYLTAEERGIPLFLRSITPSNHQTYILNLWSRAQTKIGRWIRGQIILSFAVGLAVFIGLSIFGIRYKLVLALLAAVFEVIPFIGPIIAAIPAIALGFLKSPIVALWTAVVYLVVQQLENAVLVPKIMQHAVGLNPVVIIISVLIGAQLLGFAGVILAVPIAAVIVEVIKDFGDRDKEPMRG